ncbi:MAG TPA: hypothetical protein PLB53_08250, partial [Candidatus Atribacteria bacterium]|nr:hypothetical protein [Candidatus Atribacteria bacterium]
DTPGNEWLIQHSSIFCWQLSFLPSQISFITLLKCRESNSADIIAFNIEHHSSGAYLFCSHSSISGMHAILLI